MSGISKIIEHMKGEIEFAAKGNGGTLYCEHLIEEVVALFTAYEQNQKELKVLRKRWVGSVEEEQQKHQQLHRVRADLDTANRRIAELEEKVNRYKQYVDAHQKCDSCGSSYVTMLK